VEKTLVKYIFSDSERFIDQDIQLSGWVRTSRNSKTFGFIELNDGSGFKNIQIVFDESLANFEALTKLTIGSSLQIQGTLVASQGKGQSVEVHAKAIEILGLSDLSNPIQKKRHSFEYLRTIPHLRIRTNTFLAVFRVRSVLTHVIHNFFQERNFVNVHTPIITSHDAEGAGELFRVSTLDLEKVPKTKEGDVDYSEELLGKSAYLSVSGQLNVEPFCLGFRDVYTFGPTFRSENSHTSRHASEFWMIEPEIAFGDINDNMQLAEEMLKYTITKVIERCPDEMAFFDKFVDKGLLERLENVVNSDFARVTYTEAIELLKNSGKKFEFPVEWGSDLQSEHERYLCEEAYKKPVFVTDYPKDIKAFYMKQNEDRKTVRAVDLLVPGVGELIGGSQREDDETLLKGRIEEMGLNEEDYQWYLDIRRFGNFVHSGYGLGFERALMYLTGMENIRDVIPYPRTPNNVLF
jgi:asparaginyl-tRNA synthetase